MPKRLLLVAVVLAAAGCGGGHHAAAPPPALLPAAVPPFPYTSMLKAVRGTPVSAIWMRSTRRKAPVYVAVLTGRFTALGSHGPSGAKAPTGTVATFVYDARTGMANEFSLTRHRGDAARPGAVHDFLPYLRQAAAKGVPAGVETFWLQRVSAGSRLGCETHFRNLSPTVFLSRLDAAAGGAFEVTSVQFLRACQLVPLVFIRTRDPHRAVAALPALEKQLDRIGGVWDYEGFFLEASDESGKPFALFWNHVRAEVAGGEWASAPDLYPFPHG